MIDRALFVRIEAKEGKEDEPGSQRLCCSSQK
jgi:hypothetical protein